MPNDLEDLANKATQLAVAAAGRAQADRAGRLADRLAAGRFLVSTVGQFKRGKSTLLNALLGETVVPTGVLPLTAVATEVAFGDPAAEVELVDGTRIQIERTAIADYVTEERNPGNHRHVARVEIRGHWPLLEPGVVLVDTPGIGSVHLHNTEAARAALLDADGAILVMSADAPISEQEREILAVLAERRAPTFYVLNKADHLSAGELDEVRRFVEEVLCDELGHQARVFAISARAALNSLASDSADPAAGEFAALVTELERFIDEDLVNARLATARAELARLGASLRDTLALEVAAADLDVATFARQVEQFRTEASGQREAFDDHRTLLDRDVARLGEQLWGRLSAFAAASAAAHSDRVAQVAATAPRSRLAAEVRSEIESAVRGSFEEFRQAESDRTEAAWQQLAEAFRRRTQDRVNAVREAAASLFDVPLPQATIPAVAEEHERFFFLFLHVGDSSGAFGTALGRLIPDRFARRRAATRAGAELRAEFDKHAGRARWDLIQRLEGVRRRFETAMRDELDSTIEAILDAAQRADQLRARGEAARAEHALDTACRAAIAEGLAALAVDAE